jgi:REP element-mobilizing transposase RayT
MIGDSRLDQSRLFTADEERERFLERLGERVEQYNIRLYLFVLMTNHFHLVFETPEGNCSRYMQSLLTSYTVYYNLRHGRHGHLLDGRFKAKVVDGDDYLLALTRYVHLNPVMVGGTKDLPLDKRMELLRGYRWSSYPSYIGKRERYDFVTYGPVLAEMSGKARKRPARYREFVESGLAETDEEFHAALKASPRSIGGEGFRAWVDELYGKLVKGRGAVEDIAFRHVTEPMDSAKVLEIVAAGMGVEVGELSRRHRDSTLRSVAARYLMRYAGQSQRDIGRLLKAGSGSAISKQLARHRDALEERGMAGMLSKIESQLEEEKQKRQGKATKS